MSKDPDTENKKVENIKAAGGNDRRKMRRVTERGEERHNRVLSFMGGKGCQGSVEAQCRR